ncbi:CLUMA_CG014603, isoform A [Clunio marinus]|uniref:CLUMA_CG014603, isoform A n=1 Tax=Clunio marinus TaxID=568069 RepID=A0A1J1ILS7_9DIPT|nr:CLUMA_CG014603, isoform A [Clunio marinus]
MSVGRQTKKKRRQHQAGMLFFKYPNEEFGETNISVIRSQLCMKMTHKERKALFYLFHIYVHSLQSCLIASNKIRSELKVD